MHIFTYINICNFLSITLNPLNEHLNTAWNKTGTENTRNGKAGTLQYQMHDISE